MSEMSSWDTVRARKDFEENESFMSELQKNSSQELVAVENLRKKVEDDCSKAIAYNLFEPNTEIVLRLGSKVVVVNTDGIGPRDHARNAFLQMAAKILYEHPARKSDDFNDMLMIVAEMMPNAVTARDKALEAKFDDQ